MFPVLLKNRRQYNPTPINMSYVATHKCLINTSDLFPVCWETVEVWTGALHNRVSSDGQKMLPSASPNQSFITGSVDNSAKKWRTALTKSAVIHRDLSVEENNVS